MLNPARLYPTARLQIVRDLFFREWQARALRSQPRTPNLVCGAPADYLESTAFGAMMHEHLVKRQKEKS